MTPESREPDVPSRTTTADARLEIIDYDDSLRDHFERLNREWIERFFRVEDGELDILLRPRERLVETGGAVLFARLTTPGAPPAIVGTCGLLACGDGVFELTKMGVTESAQGRGVGRRLLEAAEARFLALGGRTLFLITSYKLERALALYRGFGFVDAPMTDADQAEYARGQVKMVLRRPGGESRARLSNS